MAKELNAASNEKTYKLILQNLEHAESIPEWKEGLEKMYKDWLSLARYI